MSIAEKTLLLKTDIDELYEAGYKDAEKLNYLYYVNECAGILSSAIFPENSDIVIKLKKAPKNFNRFMSSAVNSKTVTLISEDKSNVLIFSQAFRDNKSIEILDLTEFNRSFSDVSYLFLGTINIREVKGELDLSNSTNFTAWLNSADKLEEMRFKPNSIKISISLQWNGKLSGETIQSFIDGLADLTGQTQQTIYLHSGIKAKLTEEQLTIIYSKNWNLG